MCGPLWPAEDRKAESEDDKEQMTVKEVGPSTSALPSSTAGRHSCQDVPETTGIYIPACHLEDMTKCVKPLSDLVTLGAISSKWTILIGRTERLVTPSDYVAKWFDALSHTQAQVK